MGRTHKSHHKFLLHNALVRLSLLYQFQFDFQLSHVRTLSSFVDYSLDILMAIFLSSSRALAHSKDIGYLVPSMFVHGETLLCEDRVPASDSRVPCQHQDRNLSSILILVSYLIRRFLIGFRNQLD